MSHFAEINENGIVLKVLVVPDSQEHRGQDFLANDLKLGGTWIQTSYNTSANVHTLGGTPLRKNYAGVGYSYDQTRDAFISPQPYPSWLLVESTCQWESPTPYPDDGERYQWNEATLNWVVL
jgi:hypothetical protein